VGGQQTNCIIYKLAGKRSFAEAVVKTSLRNARSFMQELFHAHKILQMFFPYRFSFDFTAPEFSSPLQQFSHPP